MNPFSRRDWKKAAYKQVDNPQGGPIGWLIVGLLIVAAALTYLVKP